MRTTSSILLLALVALAAAAAAAPGAFARPGSQRALQDTTADTPANILEAKVLHNKPNLTYLDPAILPAAAFNASLVHMDGNPDMHHMLPAGMKPAAAGKGGPKHAIQGGVKPMKHDDKHSQRAEHVHDQDSPAGKPQGKKGRFTGSFTINATGFPASGFNPSNLPASFNVTIRAHHDGRKFEGKPKFMPGTVPMMPFDVPNGSFPVPLFNGSLPPKGPHGGKQHSKDGKYGKGAFAAAGDSLKFNGSSILDPTALPKHLKNKPQAGSPDNKKRPQAGGPDGQARPGKGAMASTLPGNMSPVVDEDRHHDKQHHVDTEHPQHGDSLPIPQAGDKAFHSGKHDKHFGPNNGSLPAVIPAGFHLIGWNGTDHPHGRNYGKPMQMPFDISNRSFPVPPMNGSITMPRHFNDDKPDGKPRNHKQLPAGAIDGIVPILPQMDGAHSKHGGDRQSAMPQPAVGQNTKPGKLSGQPPQAPGPHAKKMAVPAVDEVLP